MQLKFLLVASLAAVGSAAVIEERDPANAIDEVFSAIPTSALSGLPTNFKEIYSGVTAFLIPLATAVPSSLVSQIASAAKTVQNKDFPAFLSSIVSQLPPEIQTSLSRQQASLASQISAATVLIGVTPTSTAAATSTATQSGSQRSSSAASVASTASVASVASAASTTAATTTTAAAAGTTTASTSTSTTATARGAGARNTVGLGGLFVVGIVGLVAIL